MEDLAGDRVVEGREAVGALLPCVGFFAGGSDAVGFDCAAGVSGGDAG